MGKSKNYIWILFTILSLVLVMALLPSCAEEETPAPAPAPAPAPVVTPIKLVFTDHEPAGSYWETKIGRPYFAELEKRTNGKIQVEQHYGGELVGLFDVYDAVLKGTVDIAKILPTMFADKFPVDGVVIFQPVNVKTYRAGQVWLDLYNKYPDMKKQYDATPLLGFAPMPCNGLATTSKVITKWEDAQGLKMAGAGPAPEGRQKAVGIVPVSVAPPDTYMSFKTGTLDGIAMALQSFEDFGWLDVLRNVCIVNINGGPWTYVISKQAWNKLPADVQKTMTDMVPWLTELNDRIQYENDKNAMATFPSKYGIKFSTLSQAELDRWAQRDGPTLDAYVKEFITDKGMPGDAIKKDFLDLQKKYAGDEYKFK